MLKLLFYLSFVIFFYEKDPPVYEDYNLKIVISNIKYSGKIYFALYDSAENFNSTDESVDKMKLAIRETVNVGEHEINLKLEKGYYGIKIYVDKNLNEKFDTNFFGLPKEQFGFSNNVIGLVGPPTFEKSMIYVSSNETINIILR
tara:strand:+ start:577 stop:1011 length:435 start_codon:yes stop_codon:yes gene_type:complete